MSSYDHTFSPEMTFVPSRAPYELREDKSGRYIARLNKALSKLIDLEVVAKMDPFHAYMERTPAKTSKGEAFMAFTSRHTYCVEIVPRTSFQTSWLDEPHFRKSLKHLFRGLKLAGLVPSVTRRRKGIDYEYPTGGCHIQYGADLFEADHKFFKNMEAYHTMLITEIANKPWLRWVFAQWFNDVGHHTTYNPETWQSVVGVKKAPPTPQELFDMDREAYAVKARFMPCCKTSYLTYEWRFFRMADSADELIHIARFVSKYTQHLVDKVKKNETVALDLTVDRWNSFSKPGVVQKEFQNLLDILHLPWQDYEMFYNRNFLTRLKYGKLI